MVCITLKNATVQDKKGSKTACMITWLSAGLPGGVLPLAQVGSAEFAHGVAVLSALGMEQEIPDYDLDSEDEGWLQEQSKKMEITSIKFEEMMDRLEKGSGQQVTTFQVQERGQGATFQHPSSKLGRIWLCS